MDFSEALALMKKGGLVRRECWRDGVHMMFVNGRTCTIDGDVRYIMSGVETPELLAEDWTEA